MNWIRKNSIILVIALFLVLAFLYQRVDQTTYGKPYQSNSPIETTTLNEMMRVEIKGEVVSPGTYDCKPGQRVVDVINMAGGLTVNANLQSINQSQRLSDEMVIIIPSKIIDRPQDSFLKYIYVEIKGEVVQPGVYKIKESAILYDLILEANGLTEKADTSEINLSIKLKENQVYEIKVKEDDFIHVEIRGEVANPGVYRLNQGDLLIDLIEMAGGLSEDADIGLLNLASQLINHQSIVIEHKDSLLRKMAVEIKGEVKQPGVYYVHTNTRVIDVIRMAGGFTGNASYQDVNLSQKVKDEQLIIIREEKESTLMAVDLKGEVKFPGVYYLREGSRMIDLIALAGGFRPNADTLKVNYAKLLVDQEVVHIQRIQDLNNYIYVEIKGEVVIPGIYAMQKGDRMIMLVNRAGGFTSNADQSTIILTQTLEDEMEIIIPSVHDVDEEIEPVIQYYVQVTGAVFNPGTYLVNKGTSLMTVIELAGGLRVDADINQIHFDAMIINHTNIHIPFYQEETTLPTHQSDLVNINTANVEELQKLNGVGVILAERIIQYRMTYGQFSSIDDIKNVSGIGDSIYDKIKDDITV